MENKSNTCCQMDMWPESVSHQDKTVAGPPGNHTIDFELKLEDASLMYMQFAPQHKLSVPLSLFL